MSLTAIIAGQGDLPRLLASRLADEGVEFVVAELEGFPSDIPGIAPVRFRLERLVPFLDHLAESGVARVALAGAVRRPRLEAGLFDPRTAEFVPRILAAMQAGDDGALRALIAIFEEHGFAVVGADTILPELLPAEGIPTARKPDAADRAAARVGEGIVAEMGRADSGQACIVSDVGEILREGADGTDAMLSRLRPVRPEDSDKAAPDLMDLAADASGTAADWLAETEGPPGRAVDAAGCILFKAPKPGQERRVDLPVIGPATARGAAAAGLSGIVLEAGGVMVIDLAQVVSILDANGLFLWVRARGAP